MDKKHKGAASELIACAWLLSQGYDVFRNVSQHGLADLICLDLSTGEHILVDVKTGAHRIGRNGQPYILLQSLSEAQVAAGVRRLSVTDGSCVWA